MRLSGRRLRPICPVAKVSTYVPLAISATSTTVASWVQRNHSLITGPLTILILDFTLDSDFFFDSEDPPTSWAIKGWHVRINLIPSTKYCQVSPVPGLTLFFLIFSERNEIGSTSTPFSGEAICQ